MVLSSGCQFSPRFGPQETNNTTYVDKYDANGRPVKIGKVKKNVKVPIDYIDDQGKRYQGELDIGGWDVSPPPKKKAPEEKEAEKKLQGTMPIFDGKWATPEEVKDAERAKGISL